MGGVRVGITLLKRNWLHLHDKTLQAAQEVLQKEYPNIIDKLKHEYLVPEVAKSLKPEMQDHMDRLTKTHVENLFRDYMSEHKNL
ncbi:MAG: hypothetical protein KTV77_03110 [Wolbachia endosymbiont of Fragariocoptes setiger]|nr:hypothetical protein [Wolbachia endosymbiont of Fragariocoptes setiger]